MNNKRNQKKDNSETCDYANDFKSLSKEERRAVLKTARNLLKQQKENSAMLADVPEKKKKGKA